MLVLSRKSQEAVIVGGSDGFERKLKITVLEIEGERFRLGIPVGEALAFAMGWSNLGYTQPRDGLRRVMGALAVDALEYSEQWSAAALARHCLQQKWPGSFVP